MPDRLEADTYLLQVSGGQPTTEEPPGLVAFSAPRRAARGREKDTLFLCLGLRAREPAPASQYAELIDLAATAFFGSPGSVTAALRQALAAVNQSLLDSNLRAASTAGGLPAQGGLICAALREADFYAVQSGSGMLLVARGDGLERFPLTPSRPLGLSNRLDAQYFHTTINAGEYLCLSRHIPEGWNESALTGLGGLLTVTAVLERLQGMATGDFAALVARFELTSAAPTLRPAPVTPAAPSLSESIKPWAALLRPRPTAPAAAVAPAETAPSAPMVETASPVASPAETTTPAPAVAPTGPPAPEVPVSTDWQGLMRRAERLDQTDPPPSIPVIEEMVPAQPERRAGVGAALQRSLRAGARAFTVAVSETAYKLRQLLARTMPEGVLQKDGLFTVPRVVLIGITFAFPILMTAFGVTLYLQGGQAKEFVELKQSAQAARGKADLETDPNKAREAWRQVLTLLDRAEAKRADDADVAAWRQEAQGRLDKLDGVTRLIYKPLVVGGLDRGVQIKQILLVGPSLYVLDSAGNRILRLAASSASGYLPDSSFQCAGNVKISDVNIGALIDMIWLPGPNLVGGDAVMAVDAFGNLLYCAPGTNPLAAQLTLADTSVKPVAVEFYADRLYVLDPGANQIWMYDASGGAFTTPPAQYFSSVVYPLGDVMEFTIAGGEIFLLRKDGRVANCVRPTGGAAATCLETVMFTDQRPGRAAGERLADVTQPAHLIYDTPPEPALYLLDTQYSGIYQLSLKLMLVRQFQPQSPLAGPITALALDASKRLFVGAGNNVYVAEKP